MNAQCVYCGRAIDRRPSGEWRHTGSGFVRCEDRGAFLDTSATAPDGDEPHYEACDRTIGECVCNIIEGSQHGAGIAIEQHAGHTLEVSDSDPFDEESEVIVWCGTCNVTVWYIESDIDPLA